VCVSVSVSVSVRLWGCWLGGGLLAGLELRCTWSAMHGEEQAGSVWQSMRGRDMSAVTASCFLYIDAPPGLRFSKLFRCFSCRAHPSGCNHLAPHTFA
jgi:hypothetical protein